MGSHPINLALRFLLKLTALVTAVMWGWHLSNNWSRFLLAIVLPVLIASVWGAFAVPNDPSRSGAAPVAVSGIIRLVIESGVFAFTVYALFDLGYVQISRNLSIVVTAHYIASYDRIIWLFKN